jgi:hypothetical protein
VYRADNYLKLTARTATDVRDYIFPFRSSVEAEATDALATLLGIQLRVKADHPDAELAISAHDPQPFEDMGETLPRIGDWHPDDLRPVDETPQYH